LWNAKGPMDISEVLQRVRAGDRQAFAAIVGHYQGPLFGFLGRMGLTPARAEEIAQETFLRAWTRLADFDPGRGAFGAWFYTIARRLALNELGRAPGRLEVPLAAEHEAACGEPEPFQSLALAERRQRLSAALGALPAGDRSVLALACIKELALAEVARIDGTTVGAVKTRLHRARRKLARLMENDDV